MGAAMKSCLQPLYVRACQPNTTTLNEALKDSIAATIHLLQNQKPKLIPFDHKVPAVLYADAFFEAGDRRIKVGQAKVGDYDQAATGTGDHAEVPARGSVGLDRQHGRASSLVERLWP